MKKKKGKATAIVAMAALIVLSLPVGATVSLSREKDKAASEYSEMLSYDVDAASGAAADLVTLSKKYLDPSDAAIVGVQRARDSVSEAVEAGARSEAFSTLTAAFGSLADRLGGTGLTEKDASYLSGIQSDYDMYLDLVSRSDYNEKATSFNQLLDDSPARPIVEIFGIHPLELFQ